VTEEVLDDVVAFYAGGHHIVVDGPEEALRARGYTPGYAWMKFERDADPGATAPTDLRLEVVGADRGRDFAVPVAGGFGMPGFMADRLARIPGLEGWTCLVAYDGDPTSLRAEAVAGGALFVDGDEGWLGLGATLPAARGRGAQSAILARRIALAAEQGCKLVTTETGVRQEGRPDRSYRNILRAGFREVGARPNWAAPTS
jgi:GNAT superfamily N-acetyltransferase